MRQAQIIAYGFDPALLGPLHKRAQDHGVWVREVQQIRAAKNLLRQGDVAVLLVMLGKDIVEELSLVELVGRAAPDVGVIVVGDTDNPALAALAWDLGACCVLQPTQPIELLPDIVLKRLTGVPA
jgi:DNA-binding response OmpR family regulator